MLIFLFSAWACSAVGRTAQEVVNEVRRQFIERPGIMVSKNFSIVFFIIVTRKLTDSFVCLLQEYKEKPDYGRCVAIVASASLREMIKPGALAIISPLVLGKLFILLFQFIVPSLSNYIISDGIIGRNDGLLLLLLLS